MTAARDEEEFGGAVGDLMADLVDLAARLVAASRDEGPEVICGVFAQLCSIEEDLSTEVVERLAHYPGGVRDAFALVLAAMVNPETPLKSALNWTEAMTDPRVAARRNGQEPPAERERQRLIASGVPADQALLLAACGLIEEQDTTRDRMVRVVNRGRMRAA